MGIRNIIHNQITWHYISDFGDEELRFLKDNFKFHPLDLKDCAGEVQRSKIDIYKNYIFLVLQMPEYSPEMKRVTLRQMYIFVGKDYVVTITREKMKFINNFFYKIAHNVKIKDSIFEQGSEHLLYRILDHVLRQRWKALGPLESQVQKIENNIEEGRGKSVVYEIAAMRRVILQFKTILDPQRLMTNTLSNLDVKFFRKEMLVYFDDVDDFAEKVLFSLESYRDRVLSLHEINESLISSRTNRLISLLTLFSVALMPLTLLSGIYGMNIDLPFAHNPSIIWLMFIGLGMAIILIYSFLKKNDWI